MTANALHHHISSGYRRDDMDPTHIAADQHIRPLPKLLPLLLDAPAGATLGARIAGATLVKFELIVADTALGAAIEP